MEWYWDLTMFHLKFYCRTPPYKNLEIDKEVQVFLQLFRPRDGAYSEPKQFKYMPSYSARPGQKRARLSSAHTSLELPATLNSYNSIGLNSSEIDSTELELATRALVFRNSDEFGKLYDEHGASFADLFKDAPTCGGVEFLIEQSPLQTLSWVYRFKNVFGTNCYFWGVLVVQRWWRTKALRRRWRAFSLPNRLKREWLLW